MLKGGTNSKYIFVRHFILINVKWLLQLYIYL